MRVHHLQNPPVQQGVAFPASKLICSMDTAEHAISGQAFPERTCRFRQVGTPKQVSSRSRPTMPDIDITGRAHLPVQNVKER
eukprot:3556346-Rhodomonas_salina.7